MPDSDWVKIRTETDQFEAEIIRTLLEDHDIRCVLINKKPSAYQHIGEIEIFVPASEKESAILLLSN